MADSLMCDLDLTDIFPDFPMDSSGSSEDLRELEALVESIRNGSSSSEDDQKEASGEYIISHVTYTLTYVIVGHVTKTYIII